MLKGPIKVGVNTKSFQVELRLAKSNKFELLIWSGNSSIASGTLRILKLDLNWIEF